MTQSLARNITTGMAQPMGKILELRYSSVAADSNSNTFNSTVRVTFRTPNGDTEQRYYGDGTYSLDNQHLQLMAAINAQPTDYDNKVLDLRDHNVVVPVLYNDAGGEQNG